MKTIRAEMRKWQLKDSAIWGKIYNDSEDVYDDGEEAVIMGIRKVSEGSTYFLVETDFGIYKLEKEERA